VLIGTQVGVTLAPVSHRADEALAAAIDPDDDRVAHRKGQPNPAEGLRRLGRVAWMAAIRATTIGASRKPASQPQIVTGMNRAPHTWLAATVASRLLREFRDLAVCG
jgi:hypothetical protein